MGKIFAGNMGAKLMICVDDCFHHSRCRRMRNGARLQICMKKSYTLLHSLRLRLPTGQTCLLTAKITILTLCKKG
jgi:16S rRNA U1498 N3-methylase RsmE